MTLEKFVETHKLENGVYKDFNKFKLNRLIRKYKYIDVLSYCYDDEENPDHNNWLDIEGIDYGWLWCNHKTEFARRNRIKRYAKLCYNNELIYCLEQNDIVCIIFRKYDTLINMIRLSNNELSPCIDLEYMFEKEKIVNNKLSTKQNIFGKEKFTSYKLSDEQRISELEDVVASIDCKYYSFIDELCQIIFEGEDSDTDRKVTIDRIKELACYNQWLKEEKI